jgi:hypothetical protein
VQPLTCYSLPINRSSRAYAKGNFGKHPFKETRVVYHQSGNDKFDIDSRTITSIKSLDLNAKSYQSGNAVYNRVKGYIDKLAGFKEGKWGDNVIKSGDFDNRVLELAIPEGVTNSQLEQLKRLKEYAQEQNIQLTIVLAK